MVAGLKFVGSDTNYVGHTTKQLSNPSRMNKQYQQPSLTSSLKQRGGVYDKPLLYTSAYQKNVGYLNKNDLSLSSSTTSTSLDSSYGYSSEDYDEHHVSSLSSPLARQAASKMKRDRNSNPKASMTTTSANHYAYYPDPVIFTFPTTGKKDQDRSSHQNSSIYQDESIIASPTAKLPSTVLKYMKKCDTTKNKASYSPKNIATSATSKKKEDKPVSVLNAATRLVNVNSPRNVSWSNNNVNIDMQKKNIQEINAALSFAQSARQRRRIKVQEKLQAEKEHEQIQQTKEETRRQKKANKVKAYSRMKKENKEKKTVIEERQIFEAALRKQLDAYLASSNQNEEDDDDSTANAMCDNTPKTTKENKGSRAKVDTGTVTPEAKAEPEDTQQTSNTGVTASSGSSRTFQDFVQLLHIEKEKNVEDLVLQACHNIILKEVNKFTVSPDYAVATETTRTGENGQKSESESVNQSSSKSCRVKLVSKAQDMIKSRKSSRVELITTHSWWYPNYENPLYEESMPSEVQF